MHNHIFQKDGQDLQMYPKKHELITKSSLSLIAELSSFNFVIHDPLFHLLHLDFPTIHAQPPLNLATANQPPKENIYKSILNVS